MRIYDSRVGRFLSVDPLTKNYPWYTPYQFAGNMPVWAIDVDGMEPGLYWAMKYAQASAAQKKANRNSVQSCIVSQQAKSNGIFSSFWNGVKDSYSDTKQSISTTTVKKGWGNFKGLLKDIGGMAIGDEESIESFNQRAFNASMSVANPLIEPVKFVSTVHSRSLNENMYGFGYYGFQALSIVLSERLIGEINGIGYGAFSNFEGNQIIRNTLKDGVKIVVAETADDLAYLGSMKSQALYMAGEGRAGSILIKSNATRSHILEEAIHHEQRMLYGDTYVQANRIQMEIDAQNKLLRIGQNENWSQLEMDEIRRAKSTWEEELKKNR